MSETSPREQIAAWALEYVRDQSDFTIPDVAKAALGQFDDPAFISALFDDQKYPLFYTIVSAAIARTRHIGVTGSRAVNAEALSNGRPVSIFDGWAEQVTTGHKHLKAMTRPDLEASISIRRTRAEAEERYARFLARLLADLPLGKTVGQHYSDKKLSAIYADVFATTRTVSTTPKEKGNGNLRRSRERTVRRVSRKAALSGKADGRNPR